MSQSIRHPWTKQPQNPVIDNGSPYAQGLTFCTVGGRELVRNLIPTGNAGRRGRPDGSFATFNGSSQSLVYPTGELFNTADPGITIMMRTVQTSTPAYATLARLRYNNSAGFIIFSTTDSGYFRYAFGSTTTGPANKFGPASTRPINSVDTIAIRYFDRAATGFGSTDAWKGFENGVFYDSTTNSGLIPPALETRLGDDTTFPGEIHYCYVWRRRLSDTEIQSLYQNPWQLFLPQPGRKIFIPAAGGAVTHTTTGALASDAAIIAGTATHLTLHPTSGALAAAAAAIAGTATHLTLHTTSGALAADTAVIAGSADHTTPGGTTHTTTGALAADAAAIAGTAAHLTLHTTTGALASGVAAIAGTSAHLTLHTTSGALQADGANISGVAQNGLFVPSTNQGAGSPSKTRKPRKRRFTVTVDGEDFPVSSVEEAQEILAKVRESAEEQAEVVTQRAKAVSNRPQRKVLADARKSLAVPSIKVPTDMRPAAEALRAEIESIYNAAIQAVEIGALLRKQAEQDDEDDLLMLLA